MPFFQDRHKWGTRKIEALVINDEVISSAAKLVDGWFHEVEAGVGVGEDTGEVDGDLSPWFDEVPDLPPWILELSAVSPSARNVRHCSSYDELAERRGGARDELRHRIAGLRVAPQKRHGPIAAAKVRATDAASQDLPAVRTGYHEVAVALRVACLQAVDAGDLVKRKARVCEKRLRADRGKHECLPHESSGWPPLGRDAGASGSGWSPGLRLVAVLKVERAHEFHSRSLALQIELSMLYLALRIIKQLQLHYPLLFQSFHGV